MSLSNANIQLQTALTALERVSAIFHIVPEEKAGIGQIVERLRGDVSFEDVSFSYNGQEMVLEDLSFRLRGESMLSLPGRVEWEKPR